jgi:hypothetical protein
MTQDEIIEMARQAGLVFNENLGTEKARQIHLTKVEAFAKLVAAKEREACATECYRASYLGIAANHCANAIRARGASE